MKLSPFLLSSVISTGVVATSAISAPGAPSKSSKQVVGRGSQPVSGRHVCPKCRKLYAPSFRFCEVDGAALLTPPKAPMGLSALSGKSSEVILTWKAVPNAATVIERKRSTGAYQAVGKAVPGADAFTDRTAPLGERVIYRVRAVNSIGGSPYSSEAESLAVPPAPGVPEALVASALPGARIALSWRVAKGPGSFEIQRRNGTLFETVGTTSDGRFTDAGLAPETAYAYRIRAVNPGGNSDFTSEVGVTSLVAAPASPQNLLAQGISQSQIRLEWTDLATNEEQVLVERKEPQGAFAQVAELEDGLTTYVDHALKPGVKYIYRMRTANKGGFSNYTAEQVVETIPDGPASEEREPADRTLTVRAVPSRALLAPGEVVPVEFQFRYPTSSGDQSGQMQERWYAFVTPDGKELMRAANVIGTPGELPANGSWSWKDRPMLPGDVAKKARERGFNAVMLRQSYRGKRADGTVMVWSTTITMELKPAK